MAQGARMRCIAQGQGAGRRARGYSGFEIGFWVDFIFIIIIIGNKMILRKMFEFWLYKSVYLWYNIERRFRVFKGEFSP